MFRRTATALVALQAFAASAAHAQDQQTQQDQDQLWAQLQSQTGGGQAGGSAGGQAGNNGQRNRIVPYIEVGQVLAAGQGSDTLTYTTLDVGIDASVQTRRVQVQLDYQYQHQFAYGSDSVDAGIHSGLARAKVALVPGLNLEGGGIAAMVSADPRGPTAMNIVGNGPNLAQVYAGYIGPTLNTRAGPFTIDADYRLGYTKMDAPYGGTGVTGAAPLDLYNSSWLQQAGFGIGLKPGAVLPIGLKISGEWTQEDTDQLYQHYAGAYFRGDLIVPLGGGFSLIGSAGYEHILATQRAPLVGSDGQPVVDNGRFVTDPNDPTDYVAFATDGLFWGAGFRYRPSQRFLIEAKVGQTSYGSMSYTGSLDYNNGRGINAQIRVYDTESTFGMALNSDLVALPTSYWSTISPFGGLTGMNSCIFTGATGQGSSCMNATLQSVTTNDYRARGVSATLAATMGRTSLGLGLGYQNSLYQAPVDIPASVNGESSDGYFGNLFFKRQLNRNAGIQLTAFAGYTRTDLPDSGDIWSEGASGNIYYNLGHLGLYATVGVTEMQGTGANDGFSAQAMVGARYSF